MPVIPAVPWDSVYPTMATGDLLVSAGTGKLDEAIKLLTGGPFSHAGMITRASATDPALYWEESMVGRAMDPRLHKLHPGAQLGDLLEIAQAMIRHGMRVYYIQLDWDRPADLNERLDAILDELDGHLPFTFGPEGTEMAWDYFEGRVLHKIDHGTSMFCSELVAYTFQKLGMLPDEPPRNAYAPSSFTPSLELTGGARFREPVEVQVPKAPTTG